MFSLFYWRTWTGQVFLHTEKSNAWLCHHCLQPEKQTHNHWVYIDWLLMIMIKMMMMMSYSAREGLQEFDLLVEFDVVSAHAVQLALQCLKSLLKWTVSLKMKRKTASRSTRSSDKHKELVDDDSCTHSLQLQITRAETLSLTGDDGQKRIHLTLRKICLRRAARTSTNKRTTKQFHKVCEREI